MNLYEEIYLSGFAFFCLAVVCMRKKASVVMFSALTLGTYLE